MPNSGSRRRDVASSLRKESRTPRYVPPLINQTPTRFGLLGNTLHRSLLTMPGSRNSRTYVILNAAMSLDGKIATFTGDSQMSSPADLRRVHRLRASVDAIMIGRRTLLVDDPKLTVKFVKGL